MKYTTRTMSPWSTTVAYVSLLCIPLVLCTTDEDKIRSHLDSEFPDREVAAPPKLTKQPPKQVPYKGEESAHLDCEATGNPAPNFWWEKDGQPFTATSDGGVKTGVDKGTLTFALPDYTHEGVYQCFANNSLGRALSQKVTFKLARTDSFPSVDTPLKHPVDIGEYLKLECTPPYSYPKPHVYWGLDNPEEGHESLKYDDRVTLDYKGHLHFANVKRDDSQNGRNYVCIAENLFLRSLVKGDDQRIEPNILHKAVPDYKPATLKWSVDSPLTVLIGDIKAKLKCIFAGFPTPRTGWRRLDSKKKAIDFDATRMKIDTYGHELVIENVQLSDGGWYQCYGVNSGSGREVTQDIQLTVEAVPSWLPQGAPISIDTADEENATFICKVSGIPKPTIVWTRNGRPLSEIVNPRRNISDDGEKIVYTRVIKDDAGVLQCNASNVHGYIFTNAYLNVQSQAPTFLTPPQEEMKVAQGKTITLSCEVYGAPKPTAKWFHDGREISLNTDRFIMDTTTSKISFNLTIQDVQMDDSGIYRCLAVNKFGDEHEEGRLTVRKKTVILQGPKNQTANATDDVVLQCAADTDPEERHNLNVTWYFQNQEINYAVQKNLKYNPSDFSLTIKGSTVRDKGVYKCIANNGLDQVSSVADVVIRDRPEPPQEVWVESCGSRKAVLAWTPGFDCNEPLIEHIVYYRTDFDSADLYRPLKTPSVPAAQLPEDGWKNVTVKEGVNKVDIQVSPWTNYTFEVKARNAMGMSDASKHSTACQVPPDVPYRNPNNSCSISRGKDELVVTWDPMPRIDHNGEGFRYRITYTNVRTRKEESVEVLKWDQHEISIPSESFVKYEVSVAAVNNQGPGPVQKLEKKYMFSGEDEPSVSPTGLSIDNSSMNDTSVSVTWNPVEENNYDVIKGFFRGYKLVYWIAGQPDVKRSTEIILNSFELCPPVPGTAGRRRRQAGTSAGERSAIVRDLWPFQDHEMGILVLNGGNEGKLSDTIKFKTPEGLPGPVGVFRDIESGSHHVVVEWEPPMQPNGVIVGYAIAFKEEGSLGPKRREIIRDPLQTSYKIEKLEPNTTYVVEIQSETGAGFGGFNMDDAKTKPKGAPDAPGLSAVSYEDGWFNVSFDPTIKSSSDRNPGNAFKVMYKKKGDDKWDESPLQSDAKSVNISVEEGEDYEIMVVAVSGYGKDALETPSEVRVYTATGATPDTIIGSSAPARVQPIAKAGWFYGMIAAIIFLLLILLIICLVYRNRGGKYPVYEKEKLRGHPDDDEEEKFGEYNRPSETSPLTSSKPKTPTNGDLDESKPLGESESDDSMAEYEDTDPSKFNEDGSFIGQYGGEKIKDDRLDHSNAMSTVV